jgi:Uncharacterized conserved protein
MRLVQREMGGADKTIATDIEVAESWVRHAIGLMFRRRMSEGEALVFEFDEVDRRDLGMLFVPFDIGAIFLRGGKVVKIARLEAWTGRAGADADRVIEVPPGTADRVYPGRELEIIQE